MQKRRATAVGRAHATHWNPVKAHMYAIHLPTLSWFLLCSRINYLHCTPQLLLCQAKTKQKLSSSLLRSIRASLSGIYQRHLQELHPSFYYSIPAPRQTPSSTLLFSLNQNFWSYCTTATSTWLLGTRWRFEEVSLRLAFVFEQGKPE